MPTLHLNSIGRTTKAIWAGIKKYNLNLLSLPTNHESYKIYRHVKELQTNSVENNLYYLRAQQLDWKFQIYKAENGINMFLSGGLGPTLHVRSDVEYMGVWKTDNVMTSNESVHWSAVLKTRQEGSDSRYQSLSGQERCYILGLFCVVLEGHIQLNQMTVDALGDFYTG